MCELTDVAERHANNEELHWKEIFLIFFRQMCREVPLLLSDFTRTL